MAAKKQNLRRRGNSWIVFMRVDGRQVFKSFADRTYGTTAAAKEAAELFLTQAQADKARGSFRIVEVRRFDDFADEWLRTHPGLRPRTRELYEQRVRDYLVPVLGRRKVSEIDVVDVRRVRERAAEAGASPATQKGVLTLLSGIMRYALEQRLIVANPVAALPKRDRPRDSGRSRKRTLTIDELRQLLAAAGRFRVLFAVAAYGGLRLSEVLALTWDDIAFDQATIHVRAQLSVPNKHDRTAPHRVAPKSDSDEGADRVVFIADDLAHLLREHRGDRIPRRDEFVFLTGSGTPFTQRNVARAFDAAAAAGGIPWSGRDDKPTFHSLRHTFASAIIAGGADQGHVARLLGHSDPSFTYKRYVHEFDRARRHAESKAALGTAFAGVLA